MTIFTRMMKLATVAIIAFTMTACNPFGSDDDDDGGSNDTSKASSYLPLATDNYWELSASESFTYGSYTETVKFSVTFTVLDPVTMDGHSAYNVEMKMASTVNDEPMEVDTDTMQFEATDDAVNVYEGAEDGWRTVLKTPIETGANWVSAGDTYRIAEAGGTATVPAGDFDDVVVVIESDDSGNSSKITLAAGHGFVKFHFADMPTDKELELIGWVVQK